MLDIAWRHSGWQHQRRLVYSAMLHAQCSWSRISRFADCGWSAFIVRDRDDPTIVTVRGIHCHDRFCIPCNIGRTHRLAARVTELCEGKSVRFITLTLAASDEALDVKLSRLLRAFRKLRSTADWRAHVRGGVVFTEIKRQKNAAGWNTHLHVLVEGSFYPKDGLSAAWTKATCGSYIVDISRPAVASGVARYVVKYVAKPVPLDTFRVQADGVEVVNALHGKRLCQCFGSWRGLRLNDLPDPATWDVVCSLDNVRLLAAQGDDVAATLLTNLNRSRTCQLSESEQQHLIRGPPRGDLPSDSTMPRTVQSVQMPLGNDWCTRVPVF